MLYTELLLEVPEVCCRLVVKGNLDVLGLAHVLPGHLINPGEATTAPGVRRVASRVKRLFAEASGLGLKSPFILWLQARGSWSF